MKTAKTALGPLHRNSLYLSAGFTWLSGILWLVDKYFRQIQTDFGLQAPKTQAAWLALHGAAAMALLVLLGSLLPQHVPAGWTRGEKRPSGTGLLALCAWLALSGWGLYYAGDQGLRRIASLLHWVIGLPLPLLLLAHIRSRRMRVTAPS